MGESAKGMTFLSLRALNTITVTLALGLVTLAGWHVQNPSHFEQMQVLHMSCLAARSLRWDASALPPSAVPSSAVASRMLCGAVVFLV